MIIRRSKEAPTTRVPGRGIRSAKPFWLGADPIVEARIVSVRVVDPDAEPLFLKNRPAIDVPALSPTELPSVQDRGMAGSRRIRHLLVLDGGRD